MSNRSNKIQLKTEGAGTGRRGRDGTKAPTRLACQRATRSARTVALRQSPRRRRGRSQTIELPPVAREQVASFGEGLGRLAGQVATSGVLNAVAKMAPHAEGHVAIDLRPLAIPPVDTAVYLPHESEQVPAKVVVRHENSVVVKVTASRAGYKRGQLVTVEDVQTLQPRRAR